MSSAITSAITSATASSTASTSGTTDREPGEYAVAIAGDDERIRAAQRLRHQVFAGELGVPLPGDRDVDGFDALCDHLIVTHTPTDTVVGTYRLLPPGRTDSLYSQGEFDLSAVDGVRGSLIEAGRSCVHPGHRGGAVITLMWAALARYALLSGHGYLAGCASVPLSDGGVAAGHMTALADRHLPPDDDLRVRPLRPWTPTEPAPERPSQAHLPPLLRGYLRLGAWVCGPPAHDPDFDVADFFVLLKLDEVNPRYVRHFLPDDEQGDGR